MKLNYLFIQNERKREIRHSFDHFIGMANLPDQEFVKRPDTKFTPDMLDDVFKSK